MHNLTCVPIKEGNTTRGATWSICVQREKTREDGPLHKPGRGPPWEPAPSTCCHACIQTSHLRALRKYTIHINPSSSMVFCGGSPCQWIWHLECNGGWGTFEVLQYYWNRFSVCYRRLKQTEIQFPSLRNQNGACFFKSYYKKLQSCSLMRECWIEFWKRNDNFTTCFHVLKSLWKQCFENSSGIWFFKSFNKCSVSWEDVPNLQVKVSH